MTHSTCTLCHPVDEEVLFTNGDYRVIAVGGDEGKRYRGFCRVVWHTHVREMSDLSSEARNTFMHAVYRVESALRLSLNPDKINLASLGNMTPHLHWHVIPRFQGDATFPKPIWVETNVSPVATLDDDVNWQAAVRAAFQ
jgi:diadenosine tetraphosphate (Ap4A) HIT family hydrolase